MQREKWNPIECSGFHAAWWNAVDFMQHGPKHPDWMQWITCSMAQIIPIECSGLHAAWLNAVDSMHREKWNPIECSVFYAAWLNAVDSCSMIECSGFFAAWPKASRFNAVDFLQHVPKHPDWMQWIPCSMIECSGFYAAWPKCIPIECRGFHAASLNAVDSMHCAWMQCNPCSLVKCIPIECSGFHAAW